MKALKNIYCYRKDIFWKKYKKINKQNYQLEENIVEEKTKAKAYIGNVFVSFQWRTWTDNIYTKGL